MIASYTTTDGSDEEFESNLAKLMNEAFDAMIPSQTTFKKRLPAYWWTDVVCLIRKDCLKARRKVQQCRGKPYFQNLPDSFITLNKAVKNSKKDLLLTSLGVLQSRP